MMPQVDACIGTELLGLAHTDNGRRDCRHEFEADEPSCAAIHPSICGLSRIRRRVKRPGQVLFWTCTTSVLTTHRAVGQVRVWRALLLCGAAHFLRVALV